MRGAGRSLKDLCVCASDRAAMEDFLGAIGAVTGLRGIKLGFDWGVAESEDSDLNPQADPFMPLLRHLDTLDCLEEIHLEEHGGMSCSDPEPGSTDWPSAFGDHPRAASKLRSIFLDFNNVTNTLQDWAAKAFQSIERVHFNFDVNPVQPEILQRICESAAACRVCGTSRSTSRTPLRSRTLTLETLRACFCNAHRSTCRLPLLRRSARQSLHLVCRSQSFPGGKPLSFRRFPELEMYGRRSRW
ncbi:hypothetical protein DFJ74DRAFT_677789 [Hyaloraphidium curvatum]|nr:hypothetical protein DFJ74DRAFT_677789 [Hyaloraphidium curvatum]